MKRQYRINKGALRLLVPLTLGALAFASCAESHAQALIYTPNVSVQGCNVPMDRTQPPIRVHTADGKLTSFAVSSSGTVEFGPGATVDFSDVRSAAGRRSGYVVVYVQGTAALLPVYAFPEDRR